MVVINLAVKFLNYQLSNFDFLGPFFVLRAHSREVFFVVDGGGGFVGFVFLF